MTNLGIQYSVVAPKPIEIVGDYVFLANNIEPYEKEIEGRTMSGYSYEYIRYSKDEYIIKLHEDILDTQLALVELYEGGEE